MRRLGWWWNESLEERGKSICKGQVVGGCMLCSRNKKIASEARAQRANIYMQIILFFRIVLISFYCFCFTFEEIADQRSAVTCPLSEF